MYYFILKIPKVLAKQSQKRKEKKNYITIYGVNSYTTTIH